MLCLVYQYIVDSDSSFPTSLGHSSILNEWNMSSLLLIQLRAAEREYFSLVLCRILSRELLLSK